MKRVKIVVAYDGTNYCGWQVQPNGLSVQEVLEKHLSDLLCEEIRITGASRTDAGVHALGNVAAFNTSARMAADRISFAMNTRLPADIRIQESAEVPMEFHPRFANTVKTYEYRSLTGNSRIRRSVSIPFFIIILWMWRKCRERHPILSASMISRASARQNRK